MRTKMLPYAIAALLLAGCNNESSEKPHLDKPAIPVTDSPQTAPKKADSLTQQPATATAWTGVEEISDANFANKVLKNPGLTVVDFNATWCGPCKLLKPIFKEAASDFEGKASFASIDVDDNPTVSAEYKVKSIPLLLFFKNGKVVKSIVGLISAKELNSAIQSNL